MKTFNISHAGNKIFPVFGITALIFVALVLRLHHLDYESFWMDELHHNLVCQLPFDRISETASKQQQPPLDYWIGHFVFQFSNSDFAMRLPAALFGVGSVFFLTSLIAKLCQWPMAIGVGLIYALMPFNLYYSQEARPYSIAICLMLATLWALYQFLESEKRMLLKGVVLGVLVTCFLFSRILSPLVVTLVLTLILSGRFFIGVREDGFDLTGKQGRLLFSITVFILALAIYLPYLRRILSNSSVYIVDTSFWLGLETFISGVKNFDLLPVWQAFFVQAEPLGPVIFILMVLSPIFFWKFGLWRGDSLWLDIAILLPCAMMLNLFIFQAKSDLPFRPPYAIYLLPLALILAATTFQGLWTLSAQGRSSRIGRIFLGLFATVFILYTATSAMAFKSRRIKPDWRQLCSYVQSNFGVQHVLIFDALAPYFQWEPYFYGFKRYYKGRSENVAMYRLCYLKTDPVRNNLKPVVLLYKYHEFFLTDDSPYPILSQSLEKLAIDYAAISKDPMFKVLEMTGFSIITLKGTNNRFVEDSYILINRLISHLPRNSSLVELHVAAARLAKLLQMPVWRDHLAQAELLVSDEDLSKNLKMIIQSINEI